MTPAQPVVPRIHIVGRRNAGKTTLVCELVRLLTQQGLRIATIKHTHHNHELDTPGKDSWKHRDAGAVGVGILSPQLIATFVPTDRANESENSYERLSRHFEDCDLLLVEGDLHADAVKLEVWRSEVAEPPYAMQDSSIMAVVSDDNPQVDCTVYGRSDVSVIADWLRKQINA